MIIKKQTANNILNQIITYIGEFDKNKRPQIITPKLKAVMHNFTTKVENEAIYIECKEDEVEQLLLDYLYMLSSRKHIVSFVFVDQNNSIEILKKLEVIRNWSESYKIMPTNILDNKISLYIAFYNAKFSQKYEVDLAAKLFL